MIRTRTTLLIGNVAEDPRLGPESRAWLAQLEAEALAIIPLLQQDHWVGVTIFYWGQPHTFSETEEVVFGALPALASTAVANRRLVVNLERRVSERTEEIEEKNVQLQHSMEAAQAANHAKSLFLAKMSHELRTPLNAILGFTQLMQRDLSMSHTQQDQLNIINDSGVQLLGLINDVLDFSKIEAGQMVINRGDFDLYQLVHSLEKMLYVQTREKGIHLTVDIGVEVPRFIRADEGKIRQVLMNLLSNAVKFTHVGGVTLQMRADEDAERVRLRCDVCDTGVGIAVEEYDNLFDAFSQTTSGKNLQKGTGLGLAISHKFAEMMQGDIFVESTEGEGSIFTFTVVVEHGDPAFVRTDAPREQVVRLADSQRMPRVLIVEDNLENRLLLKQLLEPIGFDLREAENGQVALEIVEDWKPEAILLDMLMPVMDGFETIRRIRQLPLAPQPCVIAITASAFEHDRDAILAEGCDDFIGKPFVQHILLEKLQAQLGLSYTYRTLEQSNRFLADAPDLTSSDFSGLPLVWLHAANEAAVAADYQQLLDLADEIEDQSIASRLRELVQEFDFETIARATTT